MRRSRYHLEGSLEGWAFGAWWWGVDNMLFCLRRRDADNMEALLSPVLEHMGAREDASVFFHCVSGQSRSTVPLNLEKGGVVRVSLRKHDIQD